ncbi:hypothetical protein MT418_003446 [Batrachochytrium dendrobatidis]
MSNCVTRQPLQFPLVVPIESNTVTELHSSDTQLDKLAQKRLVRVISHPNPSSLSVPNVYKPTQLNLQRPYHGKPFQNNSQQAECVSFSPSHTDPPHRHVSTTRQMHLNFAAKPNTPRQDSNQHLHTVLRISPIEQTSIPHTLESRRVSSLFTHLIESIPQSEREELKRRVGIPLIMKTDDLYTELNTLESIYHDYATETESVRIDPKVPLNASRHFAESVLQQRILMIIHRMRLNMGLNSSSRSGSRQHQVRSISTSPCLSTDQEFDELVETIREALEQEQQDLIDSLDRIYMQIDMERSVRETTMQMGLCKNKSMFELKNNVDAVEAKHLELDTHLSVIPISDTKLPIKWIKKRKDTQSNPLQDNDQPMFRCNSDQNSSFQSKPDTSIEVLDLLDEMEKLESAFVLPTLPYVTPITTDPTKQFQSCNPALKSVSDGSLSLVSDLTSHPSIGLHLGESCSQHQKSISNIDQLASNLSLEQKQFENHSQLLSTHGSPLQPAPPPLPKPPAHPMHHISPSRRNMIRPQAPTSLTKTH